MCVTKVGLSLLWAAWSFRMVEIGLGPGLLEYWPGCQWTKENTGIGSGTARVGKGHFFFFWSHIGGVRTLPGVSLCLLGWSQGREKRQTVLETQVSCRTQVTTHSENPIQGGGTSVTANREKLSRPEVPGWRWDWKGFSAENKMAVLQPEGLHAGHSWPLLW